MKYPIGIQTFADIRNGGFVYVDKTALVYDLVHRSKCYFLSRPRRFGKSMLLSTIEAYFRADSELFEGLAIERLETEWKEHPVLYVDLNAIDGSDPASLDALLDNQWHCWEEQYGVARIAETFAMRLVNIIRAAYKQEQRQVVVLVDEYDKPMLTLMENGKPADDVRKKMKAIYSVLKSEDRYIRFAMLTGVTRFSKVSVFSDLNNLDDISMDDNYAEICGISEAELHAVFDEPVGELAARYKTTREEAYAELQRRYDGYHFADGATGMYNPFSVLNTLQKRRYSSYWFATGTPSFLFDVIRNTKFDFAKGFTEPVDAALLSDVDTIEYSPVPILFQSGYLTIKDYDERFDRYTLDFPNAEVREGFIKFLLPRFSPAGRDANDTSNNLVRAVECGDTDTMAMTLKTLFDQRGNYMLYEEKSKERDFRNIVYMIFSFLDMYCSAELCTAAGRMDISVETNDYVYIIELKLDKSAEAAVRQIKEHGYANRFLTGTRTVVAMGVNFSTATNSIDGWEAETLYSA